MIVSVLVAVHGVWAVPAAPAVIAELIFAEAKSLTAAPATTVVVAEVAAATLAAPGLGMVSVAALVISAVVAPVTLAVSVEKVATIPATVAHVAPELVHRIAAAAWVAPMYAFPVVAVFGGMAEPANAFEKEAEGAAVHAIPEVREGAARFALAGVNETEPVNELVQVLGHAYLDEPVAKQPVIKLEPVNVAVHADGDVPTVAAAGLMGHRYACRQCHVPKKGQLAQDEKEAGVNAK